MRRHASQARDYMTHLPVEAERCETAADAIALMQQHDIHHIPVMSGSHLKGIVSQQDLLEARARLGDRFSATPLDQICRPDSLVIGPVDPIDEVVRVMLEHKTDGAVVVDGGFVVGIFTTTDALRFISDFFGQSKAT